MGKLFKVYLNDVCIFVCLKCYIHITASQNVISKEFQGRGGRAYLVKDCVNVFTGPTYERNLTTGLHTISDIFCIDCHSILGWKYIRCVNKNQNYKLGRFLLDKNSLKKKVII